MKTSFQIIFEQKNDKIICNISGFTVQKNQTKNTFILNAYNNNNINNNN